MKAIKNIILINALLMTVLQTHCGWFDWISPAWQPSKVTVCTGALLTGLSALAWQQTKNLHECESDQKTFETIKKDWNTHIQDTGCKIKKDDDNIIETGYKHDAAAFTKICEIANNIYVKGYDKPQQKWHYYRAKKNFTPVGARYDVESHYLSPRNAILNLECPDDAKKGIQLTSYNCEAKWKDIERLTNEQAVTETWKNIKNKLIVNLYDLEAAHENSPEMHKAQAEQINDILKEEAISLKRKIDTHTDAFIINHRETLTKLSINLKAKGGKNYETKLPVDLNQFFQWYYSVPISKEEYRARQVDQNIQNIEENYTLAVSDLRYNRNLTVGFGFAAVCGYLGWRFFAKK